MSHMLYNSETAVSLQNLRIYLEWRSRTHSIRNSSEILLAGIDNNNDVIGLNSGTRTSAQIIRFTSDDEIYFTKIHCELSICIFLLLASYVFNPPGISKKIALAKIGLPLPPLLNYRSILIKGQPSQVFYQSSLLFHRILEVNTHKTLRKWTFAWIEVTNLVNDAQFCVNFNGKNNMYIVYKTVDTIVTVLYNMLFKLDSL